jgi:hypothetical protein
MANLNRHIAEGWTPQYFINELAPIVDMIQQGKSWKKPFKDKAELKAWCIDNQPYYKQHVPEVVNYFADKYGIK